MIKVGNKIINLNAIAYVELEATRNYRIKGESTGVRIYFKASDNMGNLESLFFQNEEAEYLRKYFCSVADLCGQI